MKAYILLALTLGLASPSYGASSDGPESESRRLAKTVLGAQCWEGAFTNDIVTALDAIPSLVHQSIVAHGAQFILGNTVEPRIREFIADLYGFYNRTLDFHNAHIECFNGLTLGLDLDSIKTLMRKFSEESSPGETMEGLMEIICPPPGFSVPLPPPALRMRMCMEVLNTPPNNRPTFGARFLEENRAEFIAYLSGQIREEPPMLPAVEAGVAAAPARPVDDDGLQIAIAASLIDSRQGGAASSAPATTTEDADLARALEASRVLAAEEEAGVAAAPVRPADDDGFEAAIAASLREPRHDHRSGGAASSAAPAPAAAMPADADPELLRAMEISALIAAEEAAAAGLADGTFTPCYMSASWGQ